MPCRRAGHRIFRQKDGYMSNGLNELRTKFAKVLSGLLWALAATITAVSAFHGSAPIIQLMSGAAIAATATALWMHDPIGPLTRYVSSSAVSGMVALLVLEFS